MRQKDWLREKIVYFKYFKRYKNKKNIVIERQTRIYRNNSLELDLANDAIVKIGKGLSIRKNVSIRCRSASVLMIGENVYFNNNCIITCRKKISIGNNTIFGPNVCIFDHDHNYKSLDKNNEFISKEIEIGDNVWVGANVCILKGSKIGNNSVIAAGAIVNSSIPDNTVYYSRDNMKEIKVER